MDRRKFEKELADEGYEASVVEMAPGTVNDTHTHEFDAKLLILSGAISVTTEDGKTTSCGAGEVFTLAADTPHREVVGDAGVTFIAGRRYLG